VNSRISRTFFFKFYFQKLLAACCQDYELGERFDTVEKADVVEVGEDVRETGEESSKASMCEWGIWWESRRLVRSGHTKMCSTERGESRSQ